MQDYDCKGARRNRKMKNKIVALLIVVVLISALGVYIISNPAAQTSATTDFQMNQTVTFSVNENGSADVEFVYKISDSKLADAIRQSIVGGTMGSVPVHGIGIENEKLSFSSEIQSYYAKYGLEMKNATCDITGLGENDNLQMTLRWSIPYFAYRSDNGWEIMFQPIDNESFAQDSINDTKSLQSTLSVVRSVYHSDSNINVTSKTYLVMPSGATVTNENELAYGPEIIDYGGGTVDNSSQYMQTIGGKRAVVGDDQMLITTQLITITPENLLEGTEFFTMKYTGVPSVYDFEGSASWAANDMKFGRERSSYTISLDGQEFNVTPYQLLYYSAKEVVALADGSSENILTGAQPISVLSPDSENGDWNAIFRNMTKSEYVDLARNVRDQIASTGAAPGSISSPIGTLRSKDALLTFLKAIKYHYEHGELPDNITFTPAATGNLDKSGTSIPANYAYFLLSTQFVSTDTARTNEVLSNFSGFGYDNATLAGNLNHWVYENIQYTLVLGEFTSEETLETGTGKCLDKANVYLALARTAGMPARLMSGFLILNPASAGAFLEISGVTPDGRYIIGHAWTQVYLPSEGWVFADPTVDLFRTCLYENRIYSSTEETWQEVLASHETTYGELV